MREFWKKILSTLTRDAAGSPWLSGFRPYLIIIIIGVALYSRTIFFDFTYLDDNTLILDNYPLISSAQNVGEIFSSGVFPSLDEFYYRPLLNISFMADAAVAGPFLAVFHLTNIFLHVLAAGLVFLLLVKLKRSRPLALVLSLTFLVHPVLTQAVAWIPGRNDSLLAVFVLGAFIFFLNFSERPRIWSYLSYLLFFWLAVLTKETAIFLPLLVFFFFLFVQPARVNRHDRSLLVIGSAAVGFFWILMRRLALDSSMDYLAAIQGVLTSIPAIFLYLGKLIWPVNLSVLPILEDSSLWAGIIALILFVAAWLYSRPSRYYVSAFGLLWFLAFLFPSFVHPAGQPAYYHEHRAYLPLIGLLIVISEIGFISRLDFSRRSVKIATGGILAILAVLTIIHSETFKDRLTFWEAAVERSPHSPLAQRNLGVMHYFSGDNEGAVRFYQAALDINPLEPMAHNNLGVIYLEQDRLDEAETEFRSELEVNPGYDRALANLEELARRRARLLNR